MRQLLTLLAIGGVSTFFFGGIATGQALPAPAGAVEPSTIDEAEYVTVKDGHLSVNGERRRFWSVIGKPYAGAKVGEKDSPAEREKKVADAHKGTDFLLKRFDTLGFNSVRLWDGFAQPTNYTKGDGSKADTVDYFLYRAKESNFKVWLAGLNDVGGVTGKDVDLASGDDIDPSTAEAWSKAVDEAITKGKKPSWDLRNNNARIWDPRLEAIAILRMQAVATHYNQWTGLRWCDDPVFGVWELSNEEWWVRRMVGGSWTKLPDFFRNSLIEKWNTFLTDKYKNDDGLKKAWKSLLPGESLESKSVLLTPMADPSNAAASLNDANPQAAEAVKALKGKYSRSDFDPQRGSDVLEFFVELIVKHKQREAAALKPLGRSLTLSPMIYDTGIGYEIQSQYLHSLADAVAHDAYVNGWGPEFKAPTPDPALGERENLRRLIEAERISANSGIWVNWLLKPPGISQGVPWLEHNKIEGKPFLAYETQIQQPAKYRADYPLRLAALASTQDWDWVCWHYFSTGDDVGVVDQPFEKSMDVTTGSHPQGYHFTYDAVQNAMMRAAGLAFRQELLHPAPEPTKFIYGRKSLYNPDSMDYGGSYGMSGMDMAQTVYQYGVRISIDPTREDDEVIGPVVKAQDRATHNPYTPTEQIRFDWKKGYLKWDADKAVAWTGMLANVEEPVTFEAGDIKLGDVTIKNDENILEPMTEKEKYIAFALYSTDGQPLKSCKTASLSLVSTSFNDNAQPMVKEGKAAGKGGGLPVRYARVGGMVTAPALDGMKYEMRDWNNEVIGEGTVADGKVAIPADKAVWVVNFSR